MSVIHITNQNFREEVVNSDKPVLLDFWASWCGPCSMLSPVIDEIAEDRSDIKVGKVNVDEEPELASAFQVMSIPTIILFKDGKAIKKNMGVINKQSLKDFISQAL